MPFVFRDFDTMLCRVVFMSKFWNEIDMEL